MELIAACLEQVPCGSFTLIHEEVYMNSYKIATAGSEPRGILA